MIALLAIPLMGQIVKATLSEDGTWTATDKAIEASLAVTCDPREDTGPSSPPFGMVAVEKALEQWPGSRVLWQRQGDTVERVY